MENAVKKLHLRSISARVLAYSLVFRSSHPTLFIRGENSRSIIIIVRTSKSHEWIKCLEVGLTFAFTRLVPSFLWKGTGDEIKVLEATLSSEIRKIKVDPSKPLNDSQSEPTSYVVLGNNLSQFGLIELEGGSMLCTSFVNQYAYLPNLQPTDQINLVNTHLKIVNGKKYFVMCGESQLLSRNNSLEDATKHGVVDFCVRRNFGLEDFLEAVSLFMKLEKLLASLSFSSYLGVLNEHVPEVLESFYPGIRDKKDHSSSKDVYKEFLVFHHKCRPLKEGCLEKLEILLPDELHDLPTLFEDSSILWTYKLFQNLGSDVGKDRSIALVGMLEVDLKTGNLRLRGGCGSIKCLIPEDKEFKMEILKCINKLVVIKEANRVLERFMIHSRNKEQLEERLFNYILLRPGGIRPIVTNEGVKEVDQKQAVNDSGASRVCENDMSDELMDVEDGFLSQRFVLHYASAPVILESTIMYFALVSLIKRASCDQESDMFSRWCLLCMQGTMLQHFPCLCENRVYEVKYPKSYGEYHFDKSFSVPELSAVKKILPFVQNGVLISSKFSLCGPFESPHLPVDSVISKEIYGVNDALQTAAANDVVHVKGILLRRDHQTSKFQHYASNHGLECGVPGGKNILLQLQDTSNSMVVNIYIIKWTSKQYPLGILPGATICVKFVEKRFSSKSNSFFQSTCLTSIQVLEYPSECYSRISCPSKIRQSNLLQESTQPLNTPFWTILSVSRVWFVEIAPSCDKCESAVYYGSYQCQSCERYVREPVISCRAKISVEDGTNTGYLSVKNDHVRCFLEFEEEQWEQLKDLSMKKKLRYFCKKQASPENYDSHLDADQRAFKLFCERSVFIKIWKVVCKKFGGPENGGGVKIFCLDVEEVGFDLAESLVDSE